MSTIRKLRSQLKQSLHQHLMHLYQSYREMYDQEQSSSFIVEALKEEVAYFTKDSLPELQFETHLKNLEERYTKHLKSHDPDLRALADETLAAIRQIRSAQDIEEEFQNGSRNH